MTALRTAAARVEGYWNVTFRSSTLKSRGAKANGSAASTTAGGSSSSSVNCAASVSGALDVAVDAVELPHHPRGGGVVAECQKHGLEAGAGRLAGGERRGQTQHVGQDVHWRRHRVDAEVLVVPRPLRLRPEVVRRCAHGCALRAALARTHARPRHCPSESATWPDSTLEAASRSSTRRWRRRIRG